MIEDAEKMDENKKKDTLKRMGEMADLNAIRQIKECLLKNEKGDIKGTVQNYMMIFRDDPLIQGCLRYNRLSERVDISRKLWWDEDWEILTDNAIDQFYLYFEVYYGLGNEKNLYKALQIEAANRAYHPICEYLETLKWDGEERIRYVLKKYMGADDSDYVYEVLKHFMMEALLRVFYPGIKADEMLCLVGQQGAGKSTFFRFLSLKDNWFSDDLRDLGDKKVFESIRGHWIIEMSEMIAAISAKSNEEIKSFLSRQKDTYRTAYARFEKDRKRQCVFAGSTNTYQFIPFDRTGARRFLPIMIDASKAEKHILDDEEEARAYFNQLWAEAMIIYHSEENKGNLLKFTKEMQKEIDEYRKQFMQEDTLAGTIQGWLDNYKGNYVCSIQIWSEAFNHGDREPKKYETNEICQMGILDKGQVLYIAKVDSESPIRIISSVGKRLPAYCTALGKAMLSNTKIEDIKKLYPNGLTPFTSKTITDFNELEKQLKEIKNTSIAYEFGEINEPSYCLSTPLMKNDDILAAISVSVPSFRMTKEKNDLIKKLLLESKIKIETYFREHDIDKNNLTIS